MSQAVQDVSPVVQTMDVEATPERVFSLWTEPEELVRWWPEAAVLEPRVGGQVRLEFKQGNVTGAIHGYGWQHFLGCLSDLVAGRRVDKTPKEMPES